MTALIIVGVLVLVALVLLLMVILWGYGRKVDPPVRCRPEYEQTGQFIGRGYCHTHHTRWDDDGPCPRSR